MTQLTSATSSKTEADVEAAGKAVPKSLVARSVDYLQDQVDPKKCIWVSIYACFLTGYTSAMSFSACFIWCGFQTGNVAQLGIAIARAFDPIGERTYGFEKPDQQAVCSLLSFLIGTTLGRIGDKIGAKRRTWLVLSSLLQVLLAAAATIAHHYSGQSGYAGTRHNPSWTNPLGFVALAFISASLGLQGIIGKRIGSPMNTTVVLTTTWVEIFNDPLLLAMKKVQSRDVRVSGVLALLFGAFVSRAISGGGGVVAALGALCGFRLVQTLWWVLTPSPPEA